jgi:hypothetical protein
MRRITHVRPFAEGFLAQGLNDAGAEIKVPMREVRCGVISPTESSLYFYFVMLGQRLGENSSGKEPLIFVSEFAGESQEEFFRKLGEDLNKMLCKVIYTDWEGQKDFYLALHNRFSSSSVSVLPAPFASDIAYGKTFTREWLKDGALLIPKYSDTILKAELQKIDDDERSGKKSLAFHALRFVLGGFIQDPPRGVFPSGGRSRISGIV